jgi:hypothetical protein
MMQCRVTLLWEVPVLLYTLSLSNEANWEDSDLSELNDRADDHKYGVTYPRISVPKAQCLEEYGSLSGNKPSLRTLNHTPSEHMNITHTARRFFLTSRRIRVREASRLQSMAVGGGHAWSGEERMKQRMRDFIRWARCRGIGDVDYWRDYAPFQFVESSAFGLLAIVRLLIGSTLRVQAAIMNNLVYASVDMKVPDVGGSRFDLEPKTEAMHVTCQFNNLLSNNSVEPDPNR